MKQINLFGQGVSSFSKVVTSQRRLNCYWDIRKDQDKSDKVLLGTPGLSLVMTLPNAPIRGWRVVGQNMYVVAANTLYIISQFGLLVTTVTTGALATSTGNVIMSDNSLQLMITDGVFLYSYTIAASLTSYAIPAFNTVGYFGIVTDTNISSTYPPFSITYIDGRFIMEMSGTRQAMVSGSYDGTNWGGGINGINGWYFTYFTKDNYSDLIRVVEVFNGMVILWGTTSMEFWQDVGSSPLPYARIQGTTQSIGLAAMYSRAVAGNMMYWLGAAPEGSFRVFRLNGYTPERVSDADIEAYIEELDESTDAVALVYTTETGHVMYQLTFPIANATLLYDTVTGVWSEAQSGLAIVGRHQGQLGITFQGLNYCSDALSGNIYQFDDDVFTDDGVPIKRQAISRHIRDQGNELDIGEIFLDMETGVGLQSGQGSQPQIMLDISKDGGRTFGTPRNRPIGAVGQYRSPRVTWRRNGSARDFVCRFTMTDPVKFVITSGSVVIGSEENEGA